MGMANAPTLLPETAPYLHTQPRELHCIDQESLEFYQKNPPEGNPLQGLWHFDVDNNILEEEEIAIAFGQLWSEKSPGPSSIHSEDLKKWYGKQDGNPTPWLTIVDMTDFTTGKLPTLLHCNILVLIPKSEPSKVCDIGLLESLWKLITMITNCCLMEGITFHSDMHGFLPKEGCSMACMEAKLQMQYMYC